MLRPETEIASDFATQLFCNTHSEPLEVDAAWQYLDWFGNPIPLQHRLMGKGWADEQVTTTHSAFDNGSHKRIP